MMYIPGYGCYVILGLSLTPKQREVFEVFRSLFNTQVKRSLWSSILLLVWEVGKGCSERKKWYWFMNSNMAKPVKYDNNTHLFYNITSTTIYDLFINFLVGMYVK